MRRPILRAGSSLEAIYFCTLRGEIPRIAAASLIETASRFVFVSMRAVSYICAYRHEDVREFFWGPTRVPNLTFSDCSTLPI